MGFDSVLYASMHHVHTLVFGSYCMDKKGKNYPMRHGYITVQCSSVLALLQAVMNLLNDESISDIDRLRLVMLYALRYEKESPVQLMQLFNKLASRSAKYKSGVI